jgi:hypothetical protein
MTPFPRPRTLAVALALLLTGTAPAFSQEPGAPAEPAAPPRATVDPNGFDLFRALLGQRGLKPIDNMEDLSAEPGKNILIVLGNASKVDPEQVADFLSRGGRVLLASDQRTSWGPLAVEISGNRILARSPRDVYRGNSECPKVEPEPGTQLPLFTGLHQGVATNRPSELFADPPGEILARYPATCLELSWSGPPHRIPPEAAFAFSREYRPNGRLLALADHSVFINVMMVPTDNDNLRFAENTLDWLTAGGRTGCLVLEDGVPQTKFDVEWKDGPPLDWKDVAKLLMHHPEIIPPVVNAVADAAEQGGPHGSLLEQMQQQRWLDEAAGNVIPRSFRLRLLLLTVMAGLLLWGLTRAAGARFRAGPRPGPEVAGAAGARLLNRRLEAPLRDEDWSEVARARVRQGLAELGVDPAAAPDRPPAVEAAGGRGERRRVEKALGELWAVAFGGPQRLTAQRWADLAARLDDLVRSARRGDWRFATTGEGA